MSRNLWPASHRTAPTHLKTTQIARFCEAPGTQASVVYWQSTRDDDLSHAQQPEQKLLWVAMNPRRNYGKSCKFKGEKT